MAIDTTTEPVVLVTETARAKILELRSAEDAPDGLGLRIEITGSRGTDFTYDLAFDAVGDAAPDDVVVDAGGLSVIVPAASIGDLRGSTLDLPTNEAQGGLVLRNPNRPSTPALGDAIELSGTTEERVGQLLDQQVNPAIAAHGGHARLVRLDGEIAYIEMGGGCQGCAMSAATLRQGIETAILSAIPEIKGVEDATDHGAGENPYFS